MSERRPTHQLARLLCFWTLKDHEVDSDTRPTWPQDFPFVERGGCYITRAVMEVLTGEEMCRVADDGAVSTKYRSGHSELATRKLTEQRTGGPLLPSIAPRLGCSKSDPQRGQGVPKVRCRSCIWRRHTAASVHTSALILNRTTIVHSQTSARFLQPFYDQTHENVDRPWSCC